MKLNRSSVFKFMFSWAVCLSVNRTVRSFHAKGKKNVSGKNLYWVLPGMMLGFMDVIRKLPVLGRW